MSKKKKRRGPRDEPRPWEKKGRKKRGRQTPPSGEERLQKIIAGAGITSRRKAESLIVQGRVQVNGHTVRELGAKADPLRDRVTVDGKPVTQPGRRRYILLNKPTKVLSSLHDPKGRPLVTDLLQGVNERVYPVGRLDFMSEGLLLLTNDGEFANAIAHPSHGVERTYKVKVRGVPSEADIERIRRGKVRLDGRPVRPESVRRAGGQKNAWYRIVLREGRNREIRRLFEKIGHRVVKLRREGIGPLRRDDLRPGEWRDLRAAEIRDLVRIAARGRRRGRGSGAGKDGGEEE